MMAGVGTLAGLVSRYGIIGGTVVYLVGVIAGLRLLATQYPESE
jgi:hypothetical protein